LTEIDDAVENPLNLNGSILAAALWKGGRHVKGDSLGDAASGSTDGSRNVGPVAIAVVGAVAVADGGVTVADASGELLVRGPDAGVDDVGVHARAVEVIDISRVQREIPLIDAVEAPSRSRLRGGGLHDAVLFDPLDERVLREGQRLRLGHHRREARKRALINELGPDPVLPRERRDRRRDIRDGGTQDHDAVVLGWDGRCGGSRPARRERFAGCGKEQ
jgi:hypothetical protein